MDEKKPTKISITLIIRWVFGLLMLFAGIAAIAELHILAALFSFLAFILLIPQFSSIIESKLNFTVSGALRFVLIFALISAAGLATPAENTDKTSDVAASATGNEENAKVTATEEDANTDTQKIGEEDANTNTYKIGDRVVVGDLAYTVQQTKTANMLGDQYLNTKPAGVYILVDMKIENLGKSSTTLSTDYVKIQDDQGRTFESDNKAWIYLKDNILLKQVQPGLPVNGETVFDVPTGGTYYLVVTDGIFSTKTAKIILGST
jgi:hypothetical protein